MARPNDMLSVGSRYVLKTQKSREGETIHQMHPANASDRQYMCASSEAAGMADDIVRGYSGQRVLSLISALIIIMTGGVGFLVGAFSQPRASAVYIWIFTFQPTPVSMAVYGMVFTTIIFLILLLLIKTTPQLNTSNRLQ